MFVGASSGWPIRRLCIDTQIQFPSGAVRSVQPIVFDCVDFARMSDNSAYIDLEPTYAVALSLTVDHGTVEVTDGGLAFAVAVGPVIVGAQGIAGAQGQPDRKAPPDLGPAARKAPQAPQALPARQGPPGRQEQPVPQVPQDQQYHGCTGAANPSAGAGVDGQNYGQTNGKLWEKNRRLQELQVCSSCLFLAPSPVAHPRAG